MFHTLFHYFKRSPRAGDGKEPTMSHPTESPGGTNVPAPDPSAPPTAATPDISRQIADLTDAVNQVLAAQRQQPASSGAADAAPAAAARAARERYVRDHMSDLPEAYRRQMPDAAADEQQLAEAEQEIRRQFRGDLRTALSAGGATADDASASAAPDVGGEIPGGRGPAAAAATLDYARLSPVQQIALGLRDARPVGPAHPAVVHAPASSRSVQPHEPDTAPAGAD